MRVALAVLLATTLAGCAQPGTQGTTSSTFQQTCPAWIQGLSTNIFQEAFSPNSTELVHTDEMGRGLLLDENRPLDVVVLDFTPRHAGNSTQPQFVYVQDATLTLTVQRDDDHTYLKIYDPALGPRGLRNPGEDSHVFVPQPGGKAQQNFRFQVDLAEPHDAPHPTGVTATWTLTKDSDHNPTTASQAAFYYTAEFLYRQC